MTLLVAFFPPEATAQYYPEDEFGEPMPMVAPETGPVGFFSKIGRAGLMRKIRTGNARAQADAARELGRREDTRAVPGLLDQLNQHGSVTVRIAIIDALGEIGDRRAVSPLLAMLPIQGRERLAAVRALGRIGDARALDPIADLLGDPTVADEAIDALIGLSPRVLQRAVALLRDPAVAGSACVLLGRLGDRRAVWPMVQALSSPRARVRGQCAEALGALGDTRAQRALFALLQDPQRPVRQRALTALIIVHDGSLSEEIVTFAASEGTFEPYLPLLSGPRARGAVPSLVQLVNTGPGPRRDGAIEALGRIGDGTAADALAELLGSEERPLGFQVATTLASMDRAIALPRLLGAARAEGNGGRVAALRALGDLYLSIPLDPASVAPDGEAQALARSLLGSTDIDVAGAAAFLAGATRDTEALEGLAALLGHQSPILRAQAASSLGWYGSPSVCPLVGAALEDPHEGVSAAAAWSAGQAGCRDLAPQLQTLLDRGTENVAANAAWSAGALGLTAAGSALRRRLTEGGPALRANAALALAELGEQSAASLLRRRLAQEQSLYVRAAIVTALGRMGDLHSTNVVSSLTEEAAPLGAVAQDVLDALESESSLPLRQGSSTFRTRVVTPDGIPVHGMWYIVVLPDFRFFSGVTDTSGEISVIGIATGNCQLSIGTGPE